MERQLNYKHLKQGFSLLEVVISLLIVSITFLAYSQLIDQNLKAQDLKQTFVEESNLKANLLTLYVICLLYTSPSPRDQRGSRMPSSA